MRLTFLLAFSALAFSQDALQYTSDGSMRFPANYREWVFLSSGLAMTYGPAGQTDGQGNPNFDNVFVNPTAYKSFLKTGAWPDKTVLVLEVRRSDSHVSINNGGRVQTEVAAVEVHVKDAKLPGGWGFYGFGKSDTAKLIPTTTNCYSCHEQHGSVDTTFVQFYPTLIDIAKQKGTSRIEKAK
jgi:hypothetical protein